MEAAGKVGAESVVVMAVAAQSVVVMAVAKEAAETVHCACMC